jgi:hypothetical protein
MRIVRGLVLVVVIAGWTAAAAADPSIGTTLQVGESLAGRADTRVATSIHALQPVGGGWLVGGELSGSLEAFVGGYGCGTGEGKGDVPAIAVSCFQPSLGVHALVGIEAAPSARTRLRLEGGAGATTLFLIVPGEGDDTRHNAPSALIRASYLLGVGTMLEADWSLGVTLEERAIDVDDTRLARSAGLILEGRSR